MPRPGSGPSSVERTSATPPTDPEWRADALAQSRHSRLDDVLVEPLVDHDPARAALICAEVTRRSLRDFAPALVLLTGRERRRVQALAAFALALFDFARQSSLEGEKLAQINRWAFELEAALDGAPAGQPVFVAMAAADGQRPWSRAALDRLVACARRRAVAPRAATLEALERRTLELAAALTDALWNGDRDALPLVAALLRAHGLLTLADDRRRHLAGLPADELPEVWAGGATDPEEIDAAVRREIGRLAAPLADATALRRLSPAWRRAGTYCRLAARHLLHRMAAGGSAAAGPPPSLGAGRRIALLLRSRWLPS